MNSVVLMAAIMNVANLEGVAVCSLLEIHQNFGVTGCLDLQTACYSLLQLVTAFCVWYCVLGTELVQESATF